MGGGHVVLVVHWVIKALGWRCVNYCWPWNLVMMMWLMMQLSAVVVDYILWWLLVVDNCVWVHGMSDRRCIVDAMKLLLLLLLLLMMTELGHFSLRNTVLWLLHLWNGVFLVVIDRLQDLCGL